jgi:hypothetical protein
LTDKQFSPEISSIGVYNPPPRGRKERKFMAIFGSVHFSNVTDANLITILQAKEKGGAGVTANVSNLQGQAMGQPSRIVYQSVPVSWTTAEGAKIVADLIVELAK